MMSPKSVETESRINQDLLEANLCFGEGSARVQFVGSSLVFNLCFSPFEEGRQESLPVEACRAWGLLKSFESPNAPPPATLVLSGKDLTHRASRLNASALR
jgi:hypothetical protein